MRAAASRLAKLRPGGSQATFSKVKQPLSEHQYEQEKKVWRCYRRLGTCSSFLALLFAIVALTTDQWRHIEDYYVGIWRVQCRHETGVTSGQGQGQENEELCKTSKLKSQNSVIGLLIFAAAFGLFATIMTVCGLLADSLARKLYYFHSAGEIFFVCFVTSLAAMITFSLALQAPTVTSFGYSYVIGWLAVVCYLVSAVCLCLDELVRCTYACRSCCCCPGASPPQSAASGMKRKPTLKSKSSTNSNSP